ncbi:hypothetical protein HXX76_014094 [Chlamydomonas incerta]|uniref:Minor capsid protein P11 C-terminal conserved region domain-containing protein n=1 Tax=Chlamydomonas incerta TaxID=51695 RepID=A0A835SG67_CHLIN|nr:hypothetical protein HXX76_014094 [Chlamydomonas incerta]|eukprot:KAG2424936.1 hypothetical protein HXX76_014094 [Chlamydomonas incerta]
MCRLQADIMELRAEIRALKEVIVRQNAEIRAVKEVNDKKDAEIMQLMDQVASFKTLVDKAAESNVELRQEMEHILSDCKVKDLALLKAAVDILYKNRRWSTTDTSFQALHVGLSAGGWLTPAGLVLPPGFRLEEMKALARILSFLNVGEFLVPERGYRRRKPLAVLLAEKDQQHQAEIRAMNQRFQAQIQAMNQRFQAQIDAIHQHYQAEIQRFQEILDKKDAEIMQLTDQVASFKTLVDKAAESNAELRQEMEHILSDCKVKDLALLKAAVDILYKNRRLPSRWSTTDTSFQALHAGLSAAGWLTPAGLVLPPGFRLEEMKALARILSYLNVRGVSWTAGMDRVTADKFFLENNIIRPPEGRHVPVRVRRYVIDSRARDGLKYPDSADFLVTFDEPPRNVQAISLLSYWVPPVPYVNDKNDLFVYTTAPMYWNPLSLQWRHDALSSAELTNITSVDPPALISGLQLACGGAFAVTPIRGGSRCLVSAATPFLAVGGPCMELLGFYPTAASGASSAGAGDLLCTSCARAVVASDTASVTLDTLDCQRGFSSLQSGDTVSVSVCAVMVLRDAPLVPLATKEVLVSGVALQSVVLQRSSDQLGSEPVVRVALGAPLVVDTGFNVGPQHRVLFGVALSCGRMQSEMAIKSLTTSYAYLNLTHCNMAMDPGTTRANAFAVLKTDHHKVLHGPGHRKAFYDDLKLLKSLRVQLNDQAGSPISLGNNDWYIELGIETELTLENTIVRWPCSSLSAAAAKKGYVYAIPLLPHDSIKDVQVQEKALKQALRDEGQGLSVPLLSVLQINTSGEDLVVLKFHLDDDSLALLEAEPWDQQARHTVRVKLVGSAIKSTKRPTRGSVWRLSMEAAAATTDAAAHSDVFGSDIGVDELPPQCSDIPSSAATSSDEDADVPFEVVVEMVAADPVVEEVADPVAVDIGSSINDVPKEAIDFAEKVQAERAHLDAKLGELQSRLQERHDELGQSLDEIAGLVTETSAPDDIAGALEMAGDGNGLMLKVGILVLIVTLIVVLHMYNTRTNGKRIEKFLMGAPVEQIDNSVLRVDPSMTQTRAQYIQPQFNASGGVSNSSMNTYPKECFPKDTLTPSDLLPGQDAANSIYAQLNPLGQGSVDNPNLLNAGYHLGINTVGQTLRNPNLQLRSDIPNPRTVISPWMQSTIEPDLNRRPLEIGPC